MGVYNEKNIFAIIKYGGGFVMLWGSFSSKSPGDLVTIHDIMDSKSWI